MREVWAKLRCWLGFHPWVDIGIQSAVYRDFRTDGHVRICAEGCPVGYILPLNKHQRAVPVYMEDVA